MYTSPFAASPLPSYGGRILIGLGVLALCGAGYFVWQTVRPAHWIYVDNAAGKSPRVVLLDEAVQATIAPGEVACIATWSGEHRVRVEEKGQTIFDRNLSLPKLDRGRTAKYVVNPAREHAYYAMPVIYGQPSEYARPYVSIFSTPTQRRVERLGLLSSEPWIELPAEKCDYVLAETPPDQLKVSEFTKGKVVYHIRRLAPSELELLKRAASDSLPAAERARAETLLDRLEAEE